jgi:hypothetical protein
MTRTPEEIARQDKLDEEYEAALKKWVDSIPKNQALIFRERLRPEAIGKYKPQYAAVTRDPNQGWRITHFSAVLEMPIGHEEFDTRLDAVRELATWERIDDLPFTVKPGEFHADRTPFLRYTPPDGKQRMVKFGGYMAGGETAQVMDLEESHITEKWVAVSTDRLALPTKEEKAFAVQLFEKVSQKRISLDRGDKTPLPNSYARALKR